MLGHFIQLYEEEAAFDFIALLLHYQTMVYIIGLRNVGWESERGAV
jgi:hypothetical protein